VSSVTRRIDGRWICAGGELAGPRPHADPARSRLAANRIPRLTAGAARDLTGTSA